MTGPVGRAYAELLKASELRPDPAQVRAVVALDRLAAGLDNGGSFLTRLLGRDDDGSRLRAHRRRAEEAGPFPRIQARDASAAARGTGKGGRRPARTGRGAD